MTILDIENIKNIIPEKWWIVLIIIGVIFIAFFVYLIIHTIREDKED